MTIKEQLEKRKIFSEISTIAGNPTIISYEKTTKKYWLLNLERHIFYLFCTIHEYITQSTAEHFYKEAYTYAITHYKGRQPSDNCQIIIIPVLIGDNADPVVQTFCERFKSRKTAIREIPVLYHPSTKRQYSPKFSGIRGVLFHGEYRRFTADVLNIVENQYQV